MSNVGTERRRLGTPLQVWYGSGYPGRTHLYRVNLFWTLPTVPNNGTNMTGYLQPNGPIITDTGSNEQKNSGVLRS